MRLTLDLDAEAHRKITTLAEFQGQTLEVYILSRIGLAESNAAVKPEPDETDYLFSTAANAEHLERSLSGKPENRLRFDSVEDVKHALGI